MSVLTSCCRWEVIVFWEFSVVWSKKSAVSGEFWWFFAVFTQRNRTFNKHQSQKKFIFWQLAANFLDFRRNISILKKKIGGGVNFKIWTSRKVHTSVISRKFWDFRRNNNAFMLNNRTLKKYYPQGKFVFRQSVVKNRKFCQFLMK